MVDFRAPKKSLMGKKFTGHATGAKFAGGSSGARRK